MKHILITNILMVTLLTACSSSEELALSEPQTVVESIQADQPSNEDVLSPRDGQQSGDKPFPGFDLDVVAESLGVSSDDLSAAIEANRTQGEIDLAAAAAQLGIDEAALSDALGGAGFGPGKGRDNILPQAIDCAAAATQLNLPETNVCTAIENSVDETGRQNFDHVASELGIDVNTLMEALGLNGRGMEWPAKN